MDVFYNLLLEVVDIIKEVCIPLFGYLLILEAKRYLKFKREMYESIISFTDNLSKEVTKTMEDNKAEIIKFTKEDP